MIDNAYHLVTSCHLCQNCIYFTFQDLEKCVNILLLKQFNEKNPEKSALLTIQ